LDFVHLHVHSHFSEDGVPGIDQLVRQARDIGLSALALTDHNTLAGLVPFCEACSKYGVRPVIGCELDVLSSDPKAPVDQRFRIVLLVESEPGYRSLIALINLAYANARRGHPVLHFDDLGLASGGLIALTGGGDSELFHMLSNGKSAETEAHINNLARFFGRDNLIFEIQDFGSTRQKQVNDRIYRLNDYLSMRCVATNDVHYLRPEEAVCHEFLKQGPPPGFFGAHRSMDPATTRHLATGEEMRNKFLKFSRALYATAEVADRCSFQPNFDKKRFPIHDFVRGFDADSFLWDLTFREARGRYAELSTEMKDRLNQEFDFIKTQRLSNNILLLWNIAQFCHKNRISVGVGRGNMISSLVAFILGITQINPLDYKLRFLGFGEEECGERQLVVEIPAKHIRGLEDFLKDTFGADSCSGIGKYEWYDRGQISREICAWLDLNYAKMEEVVAQIEQQAADEATQADCETDAENDSDKEMPVEQFVAFLTAKLLPRPKTLRVAEHQFAISGENLNHLIPRVDIDGDTVTQFDSTALDRLNIPRLIIDWNPLLNILDSAAAWVRTEENAAFDPDRIPLDDSDTFTLLSRGLTNGIDPFHSITMKSLLRANRPRNFMSLVKIKTMERTPEKEQSTDVREHVPECLLTYRCAFIKAHYPISFMAALLTHSYRNRKKFTVILREAKQMGLKILPPDINHSVYEFSQAHKSIRTGLMVVSGMSEKAYAEIALVRKGGDYNDPLDLAQRTDSHLINNRLLSNLVKTGALDSFGMKRSQMLRMIEEEADEARKAPSGARPHAEPARIEELSQPEIIKHEIAAAGYCISVDQLHLYRELIQQCRALSPYELSTKHVGKQVHLAGFLEHIEYDSPLIDDGDQVLLDLEGRVVTMPLKASRLYEQALKANAPVLVGGTVMRRKEEVYVKALTAFTLRMVQQMSQQVLQLDLDLAGEDNRTLWLIRNLVIHYRGKGTRVHIHNFSGTGLSKWHLAKIARTPVFFSPPFYYALKKILPEDRISLLAAEEMDPDLLHTLSPTRFARAANRAGELVEAEQNSAVADAY
jgi:DNA polymerase III alpha subunit